MYYFLVYMHIAALFIFASLSEASIISSSEIQMCAKTSSTIEPVLAASGNPCTKKMVVAMTLQSGQGPTDQVYASIEYVANKSGATTRREKLLNPYRISVSKSDVMIHYPLLYRKSVNNRPSELHRRVSNAILGISSCRPDKHCSPFQGYCCSSSTAEKLSAAWEYKRGEGTKQGHYFSHKYSQAICMQYDDLWYNIFEIGSPFVTYSINITVERLEYQSTADDGSQVPIWSNVGSLLIGPQNIGDNTARKKNGSVNVPEIIAEWEGDFSPSSGLASFNSKYLLVPDWRASPKPEVTKQSQQIVGGAKEWLLVDKQMVRWQGDTCNTIGSDFYAFKTQENRCYQKADSCFQVTPKGIFKTAKELEAAKQPNFYFPPFYGDFVGGRAQTGNGDQQDFQLVYRSRQSYQSLVTLAFVADSVYFVTNVGQGRIVEATIGDFMALSGSSPLTVAVQNTGRVTAAFSVEVGQCTDGIIRVSERTMSINPGQQATFTFEISTSLNQNMNHTCQIQLTNAQGDVTDSKFVHFKTTQGCVYCPAGVCHCDCMEGNQTSNSLLCHNDNGYIHPLWKPTVIVVKPCYFCWITKPLKRPPIAAMTGIILLLSLGMIKLLVLHTCCQTKDGRPVDLAGLILGTTDMQHTKEKTRNATIQFVIGSCFFLYLPLLPCLILVCKWRRRGLVRERLRKKEERKRRRMMVKTQQALLAMKGLMVQNDLTMAEALTLMDRVPDRPAPQLPAEILSDSSGEDTDAQDFDYESSTSKSSEDVGMRSSKQEYGSTKRDEGTANDSSSSEATSSEDTKTHVKSRLLQRKKGTQAAGGIKEMKGKDA